jgi:hypothetical protein
MLQWELVSTMAAVYGHRARSRKVVCLNPSSTILRLELFLLNIQYCRAPLPTGLLLLGYSDTTNHFPVNVVQRIDVA